MALGKAIITVEVRRACSLLPSKESAVASMISLVHASLYGLCSPCKVLHPDPTRHVTPAVPEPVKLSI